MKRRRRKSKAPYHMALIVTLGLAAHHMMPEDEHGRKQDTPYVTEAHAMSLIGSEHQLERIATGIRQAYTETETGNFDSARDTLRLVRRDIEQSDLILPDDTAVRMHQLLQVAVTEEEEAVKSATYGTKEESETAHAKSVEALEAYEAHHAIWAKQEESQ